VHQSKRNNQNHLQRRQGEVVLRTTT